MSEKPFTAKQDKVALSLAEGKTIAEAADIAGVAERTVYRWKKDPNFAAEVDRLTLQTGIATKAERLRIARAVIAGRMLTSIPQSNRDLLDWLKYAQEEVEGININVSEDATNRIIIEYIDVGTEDTVTDTAPISANGHH